MINEKSKQNCKGRLKIMMFFTVLLGTTFGLVESALAQDYRKLMEAEINLDKLQFATRLAENIMSTRKNGQFYQLTEKEASPEMILAFNEERQRKSYAQLKLDLGDFVSLEFDHIMKSTGDPVYELYRFKSRFESWPDEIEIRVVLDEVGRLDGFWTKYWVNEL